MKTVFAFGSRVVPGDSLALEVCKKLRGKTREFDFVECETLDELLAAAAQKGERDLIVLDVVQGLKKTRVIEDLSEFVDASPSSMHDFDAGFFLKIAKESGVVERVRVIGLPPSMSAEKAAAETKRVLEKL
ncbi:hypothetical protein H0O03_00500 [Candidatus Micrarchaeota archaeon]|nr:hypothetical protein [Candidatus Micrarchaeota archaeon]